MERAAYKIKEVVKFCRKARIADAALTEIVEAADLGQIGAELGGGLYKVRVARRGEGKSGGYRFLIAYQDDAANVYFLHGYAKNVKADISDDERTLYLRLAARFRSYDPEQIAVAVENGILTPLAE